MLATYHNHSRWSDGKATIPEIIVAAKTAGIAELGISDHWVVHPSGRDQPWAMPTDKLAEYVGEMLQFQDQVRRENTPSSHLSLRLGVEADWHPGQATLLTNALSRQPFDYVLGSVHEVDGFPIDMSPHAWSKLSQDQRDHIHRRYWVNMVGLAESGVFDIASHLDLPKKFGFYPSIDLSREIGDALDAIAAAGLVVELNTSGWHKPCADGYPTLDILRACRRREIRVTINADAHQPEHLLRDFDRAAERLAEAGYTEVARFAGREVRMEPLADAVAGLP